MALKIFLSLGILALLSLILTTLKFIFLPLILAFFIACICNPLVIVFQRWGVPRVLSIVFTLALAVCVIIIAVNFVLTSLASFQEGFPTYKMKFDILTRNFIDLRERRFNFVTLDMLQNMVADFKVSAIFSGIVSQLVTFSGYLFLTVIFILYILPALPRIPTTLRRAFPGDRGRQLGSAVESIGLQVQSYILVKTMTSIGQGAVTGGVCLAFGVDFAATWGILAFILNFIPTVGAIISVSLPAVIYALQMTARGGILLFFVLTLFTFILGNFIEPKILGRSVNLNPFASLLALLIWGWIWGGAGMAIAVPTTAVIKFTCDNIPSLKPLGNLMGSGEHRPPGRRRDRK